MQRRAFVPGLLAAMFVLVALAVGCGGSQSTLRPPPSVTTVTTTITTTVTAPATTVTTPTTPATTGGSALPAEVAAALTVPVSGSGGFNYTQGSYLEGFEFTVHSPITVSKLGAYDSNLSALPEGSESFASVPVALYDLSSHTRLGAVTVSASDPPSGVYRYAALASPLSLNTTDNYAIVWVSLSDYYVASPTLVASDVSPAIAYLAMAGNGPGGLTMTSTMVEPNWFFSVSDNGLNALNYDLGPNFLFTTSH